MAKTSDRYKALQISAAKHLKVKLEATKRGISLKEFIERGIDLLSKEPQEPQQQA